MYIAVSVSALNSEPIVVPPVLSLIISCFIVPLVVESLALIIHSIFYVFAQLQDTNNIRIDSYLYEKADLLCTVQYLYAHFVFL